MRKRTLVVAIAGTLAALTGAGYGVARHVGLEDVFRHPIMWTENSVNMATDLLSDAYDQRMSDLIRNYVATEGDKLVITLHGAVQTNKSTFKGLEGYLNEQDGILCANIDWDYRQPIDEQGDALKDRISEIQQKTGIASENTYIFGHSMGGTLALCLSDKIPDLGGVVVVGGAFYGITNTDNNLIELINLVPGAAITDEAMEQFSGQFSRDLVARTLPEKVISVVGTEDRSGSLDTSVIRGSRYVLLPGQSHLQEAVDSNNFPLYLEMVTDFSGFRAPTK